VTAAPAEVETRRLRSLRSYRVLDTAPEASFDDLTALAARVCETPIAYISLIDETRQWFKAKIGIDAAETPRQSAFCAHAILEPDRILEVADAAADARFARSEWVTSPPRIRFYAGAPLVDREGLALGALCVMDRKPRVLTPEQREALQVLSRHAVDQLELRSRSRALAEEALSRERAEAGLRLQNEKLSRSQAEASRLLELAEKSRGALLSILEDEQRTTRALARSNRALKMLSSCNETLIWATDETALLKQICRIAVELGGHKMAWVGYAQEDEARSILPMGQWGDDDGYLAGIDFTWAAEQGRGQGPAGRCVREGRAMACGDITDPAWKFPARDAAKRRGYKSVICLPLRDKNRTFGLLALYSDEIGEIGEAEVRLLQELADDLAFGIGAVRARAFKEKAEEALVASLREKEALLKEVHHRVKNNLQVIASLLRLEGRRIEHPITQSVLKEMQGRIQSMALLHETLYRSGNFATVDLASYLTQLAQQLFRSLASQTGAVGLELALEPALLQIDQAIPCGLIVNELASNSLKHGFPDGRAGTVRIGLRSVDGGEALSLSVSDNGVGLPENFDPHQRRSLGLQLVSDLARQIQGSLVIGPGPEARFEVTFKRNRTRTGEIPRGDASIRPDPSHGG
jgi:two-component sensor histidine kinase/putative methionine-R-sulfoxide reductase with GAF domain